MKWIFYILALGAALLFPVERSDVGKLQPIEVVCLYIKDGYTVIETDTGDIGKGATVSMALEDLKNTTPGIVYLDTAEYLLIGDNAEELVPEIGQYLKKNVKLCGAQSGIDPAKAAPFLDVHNPEITLRMWKQGMDTDYLTEENESLRLVKKESEKS